MTAAALGAVILAMAPAALALVVDTLVALRLYLQGGRGGKRWLQGRRDAAPLMIGGVHQALVAT